MGSGIQAAKKCLQEGISMKLKALSHYNRDMDTRFGDCILLYDTTSFSCIEEIVKKYMRTAKQENPSLFCERSYTPHSFRHSIAPILGERKKRLK